MNYKNIIKSRRLRLKILSLLNWIPDSIMIPLQYWIHTGRKLNLKKPTRFTEKLQLYKLKYRNPLMLRCTDKYEVRKVIEEMGLKEILIPLIGIYNNPSEINFEKLPNEFVAKTTDGGGGNQVFICRNKHQLNQKKFFELLKEWMNSPKRKNAGREWAYENGFPRRIIIEDLIKIENKKDLPDYKFFCFDGKVGIVYGISERVIGKHAAFGIYNPDFIKLEVGRNDERPQTSPLEKPLNYDLMISLAEKISKPFPHARIDLYNVNGQIYFGEITFYDGSGYMTFTPDSFDYELGNMMYYPFKKA